jgi:hypothetical protein
MDWKRGASNFPPYIQPLNGDLVDNRAGLDIFEEGKISCRYRDNDYTILSSVRQ